MVNNPKFQGKILIIGGGIAGPALALFLQKAGIESVVYEAYPYKEGVGGGLGLAPNGMNVLQALGLAEKVIDRGSLTLENVFYNARGCLLARVKRGARQKYGQPAVSLLRPALYDIMTEAMKAQRIQVEYQKRLKTITQTATEVMAHFDDGTSAEGDLLIGADGIYSKTRQTALPNSPKPAYVGIIGVGGVTPAAALPMMTAREKQSLNFTFGAKGFFGYGGAENGDVMWWSNLAREKELTREELADLSLVAIKRELLAIYQGYHEPIETLIQHTQSPIKQNISDIQSLPTWYQGRVLLIGDAAHAVSPNAGQGAAMALEDAMYLAKLLRDSAGNYMQVFTQFEKDRKPRVEKIVAEGRRLADDKQVVTPFQEKIREIMMMIFINLFGERGYEWVYKYKIEWE
jgi:2-polyprenyl-6-methoxyphenol hydroxylase-like FAD-dependent oxidoreductase